ncbi:hypothetical protein K438DRAFT_1783713 [Mycena galopus ATCC 62051]|nr:hypothetical protein K438DRAFT_1783713 [Mycena galopus ATCC 62051]
MYFRQGHPLALQRSVATQPAPSALQATLVHAYSPRAAQREARNTGPGGTEKPYYLEWYTFPRSCVSILISSRSLGHPTLRAFDERGARRASSAVPPDRRTHIVRWHIVEPEDGRLLTLLRAITPVVWAYNIDSADGRTPGRSVLFGMFPGFRSLQCSSAFESDVAKHKFESDPMPRHILSAISDQVQTGEQGKLISQVARLDTEVYTERESTMPLRAVNFGV